MYKKILIVLIVALFSQSALAIVMNRRKFVRDVTAEIQKMDQVIFNEEQNNPQVRDTDHMWLRMQLTRGIASIPFVGVSVVPEIEMHWKRKGSQ